MDIAIYIFLVLSVAANATGGWWFWHTTKTRKTQRFIEAQRFKVASWQMDGNTMEARLRKVIQPGMFIEVDKWGDAVSVVIWSDRILSEAEANRVIVELPKPKRI